MKLFGIKGIDAAHAADIVVHEAHLDALFYLAREHFEDLVPEFAFLDDEVLHEDVLLGALQIGNEAGAERLANGEVLRLGVLVDERRVVAAQERLAYVRPAAHLCIQAGARNAAIFKLTGIFKDLYRARAVLAAGAVRGKGRVDGDAEQSERDDAQDPRDLGLGDHVAVGGVNGGDEHDDARDRLYDEDAPGRRKLLVDQQNEEIGQKVTESDGDADFDQKEQKNGHGDDEKPTEQFFEHFLLLPPCGALLYPRILRTAAGKRRCCKTSRQAHVGARRVQRSETRHADKGVRIDILRGNGAGIYLFDPRAGIERVCREHAARHRDFGKRFRHTVPEI